MTDEQADLEERIGMIRDGKHPPSESEAKKQAEAILSSESWMVWQRWVREREAERRAKR